MVEPPRALCDAHVRLTLFSVALYALLSCQEGAQPPSALGDATRDVGDVVFGDTHAPIDVEVGDARDADADTGEDCLGWGWVPEKQLQERCGQHRQPSGHGQSQREEQADRGTQLRTRRFRARRIVGARRARAV